MSLNLTTFNLINSCSKDMQIYKFSLNLQLIYHQINKYKKKQPDIRSFAFWLSG